MKKNIDSSNPKVVEQKTEVTKEQKVTDHSQQQEAQTEVESKERTDLTSQVPKIDFAQELKIQKDKYLRLLSDFENYKRRTSKEKLNIIKQANEELILKLLVILDDFERAIANPAQDKTDLEAGFKLIYQKLLTNLDGEGLKSMPNSKGQDFDINKHEAISQIKAPTPELVGKVIEEIEKGYLLNEKVIRYSKVVTGS